ncbi:nucleoside-diphosphate kinase [Streptomyces sp. NPDC051917]|uniref:nucleoside-diphosphate kinase n=1 Tax=Streptomyces sp. NPDC051917 TaxID=3154754 RepID=UPI003455A818
MSGAVVEGVDFARWAVILCKPDAVERGLVNRILQMISLAGIRVCDRMDVVAQAWQAHVVYRDLLADTGRLDLRDLPSYIDAAYVGRKVTIALAHGDPGMHARLRQVIGHTDPTRAAAGTIRGDLGEDSVAAAASQKRLVRNLVHISDDPAAARREYGTWYGPGIRLQVSDFHRCSVILCKPDAVQRGLVDAVLDRLAAAGATIANRIDVTVQPWQAHVHYWDLLVDADWFPDRDIPACLDDAYAGKTLTVALAYGEPLSPLARWSLSVPLRHAESVPDSPVKATSPERSPGGGELSAQLNVTSEISTPPFLMASSIAEHNSRHPTYSVRDHG